MKPRELLSRYDALFSQRKGTVEEHWELIQKYISPMRSGQFYADQSSEYEIQYRRPEVYDSTAVTGADILASSIHGAMTNPALKWFNMRFRQRVLNEDKGAREWLETVADQCYYALQDSNFDMEIAEAYLDIVCFGNSAVMQEEINPDNFEGVKFSTLPIREIYFEPAHDGTIRNLYRRLQWSALQIVDKFGADNVPDKINNQAAQTDQAVTKMDVIFCVFKREGVPTPTLGQTVAPDKRPYGYTYVLKEGGDVLQEGGYYEMPAYIPRWRKTSGSMWGYGPGNLAIPAVMTLNNIAELNLVAGEKVIDPPVMVTERGLISDLDMNARGVNVVRDIDNTIRPFDNGARFDVTSLSIAELRAQVNSIFKVDQLELKDTPAMTATEASIRYELMNRVLGPTLGRIQNDLLNPLIQRTFNILLRAGQLPDMPDVVAEAGTVDIEYNGPLTRAMKMDSTAATERWIQALGSMAQIFPEALDIPNVDQLAKGMADQLGVPEKNLKSDQEIKKLRDERAKAQQAAQEAELQKMQGEAMQANQPPPAQEG